MDDLDVTDARYGLADSHDHVQLLAGTNSSGAPVYELVPAAHVERDVYDIIATPALAFGCAAGDRIRAAADGSFEIISRGGNIAVAIFTRTAPDEARTSLLRAAFAALGGTTEEAPDGRLVVITVPVTAGFQAIERAVNAWVDDTDEWSFGNVYDEEHRPLNWWTEP